MTPRGRVKRAAPEKPAGQTTDAAGGLFDAAAAGYDETLRKGLGRWGGDIGYYAEYKIRLLRNRFPGPVGSILEFGCGVGRNLPCLRRRFPESGLSGCDVSGGSLALAASRCPEASLFICDEPGIRAHAGRFDLILIAGVLHHVTDGEARRKAVRAVRRMLKDGGRAVVFEHNPRNPVVVRSLKRIPWDDDAVLLGREDVCRLFEREGFSVAEKRYVLFFPPAIRLMDFMDSRLSRCPMGAQHYVEAVKRGSG
jgi:SAM-dependent methyltransferase